MTTRENRDAREAFALSATETAERLGVGRTKVFEEIRSGRLRSFKCGARRLVTPRAIGAWISAREAEAEREAAHARARKPRNRGEG